MSDKEKIIAEIERLKAEILYHENAWSVLDKLKVFINSLPAEQPNFKVEFAGKEYEVVRVRELSNGTTMYGILDEPNHIDYINKDNCRLVKTSEDLDIAAKENLPNAPYCVMQDNLGGYVGVYGQCQMLDMFKSGAHWQKEQMMKGFCFETRVYQDEEGDGIDTPIESWLTLEQNEIINLPNIGLKDGDKVKVIIVKEDEQ